MIMKTIPVKYGSRIQGTIYDFEFTGDTLPMHQHTPENNHISIVARGSFRMHGPKIGEKIIKQGAFVDNTDDYVEHEFVALEKNSRLVNLIKN